MLDDNYFMSIALKEAQLAYNKDEVPVGAVIVWRNKIISKAHNLTELLHDATAHAEMQAFTSASASVGGKYLTGCTLYVTLEPCVMCAGAAFWTKISRIVYGASDEKQGFRKLNSTILHPKTEIIGGVMQDDCAAILKDFFAKKR